MTTGALLSRVGRVSLCLSGGIGGFIWDMCVYVYVCVCVCVCVCVGVWVCTCGGYLKVSVYVCGGIEGLPRGVRACVRSYLMYVLAFPSGNT